MPSSLKPDAAWVPSLRGKADPVVSFAVEEAFRRQNRLLGKMTRIEREFQGIQEQFKPLNYSAIRQALQLGGDTPLDVTGLLGLLARPQLGSAAVRAAFPTAADPVSQDGSLLALTPNYAMYIYDASVLPFGWKALTANSILTFGLRAAMPLPGHVGYIYFQTDTGWLYYDNGTNYVYAWGICSKSLATLAALTVGVNDTGALAFSTDYQHLHRYNGAAWVFEDTGSRYIVATMGSAPLGGLWQLCDGSAVAVSNGDLTTSNVTTKNLTAGQFLRSGTYTAADSAATSPTWKAGQKTDAASTGDSLTVGTTAVQAGAGTTVVNSVSLNDPTHQHGLSDANAALNPPDDVKGGLPLNTTLSWYLRR